MASCFQLNHLIQDFLNQGVIEVDSLIGTSNANHTIFKTPFHTIFKTPLLDRDKGKASTSNSNQNGNKNYISTSQNYIINCFSASDNHVSTIRIKEQITPCAMASRWSKLVLKGAPSNPPKPTPMSQYNLLDQWKKHLHKYQSLSC